MRIQKVYVIGAGGHGRVVIGALRALGHEVAGIFDDAAQSIGASFCDVPVLGVVADLEKYNDSPAIIAIGNNEIRRRIAESSNSKWISVVHPSASVAQTAHIGEGTFVGAGAVLVDGSHLGDHAIVNTSASIDHDCRIEDFVHVGPGTRLAGNVTVQKQAYIGTGANVNPGRVIGANAVVGSGATVVNDVPPSITVVGVPAREIRKSTNRDISVMSNSTEIKTSKPPRVYMSPPHMGPDERELLLDAFDSNWIAPLGPHVDGFEREFAPLAGVDHAVALSSGTASLHLALNLLGVGRGDTVITSTFTFVATVNAIRYVDAEPVFVDSDRRTWNMDPELLAEELERCSKFGRLPKAVIVVDMNGQCADYDAILKTCRFYEIPVIEDAAEALGATMNGRRAGSFGDIACFSFNGNKIITTSGGGMLVTNNKVWADRARYLATQARDPAPHYEHSVVGYNYRLSNLLAAIGRGQLRVLQDRVARRRENFAYYVEHLSDLNGIEFMPEPDGFYSTRWLSSVCIHPAEFGATRETIRLALEEQNIESRPLWKPMHQQAVFKDFRAVGGQVSESLFETGLCLPSGSSLSADDLKRTVDVIRGVYQTAPQEAAVAFARA